MVKDHEVERLAKKLDKMVQKKNTDGAIDLLRELKNIKMSLETLQSTRVGMSVNAVRKQTSDEEVQTLAKTLIKSWKRLVDSPEGKAEEKKQEASSVRSSSTSKDTSTSEKSSKKSEDRPRTPPTPVTPTTPTPRITTFPPPPVNNDSVRNKSRQLLVAALQTDDDYKAIGADCEHLATEIEDHIYQEYQCTDMKYKSRLRSRISNLKDQKNPELRRNVLHGNITAQRIASMCAEDMASAELKQIRETMTKESIRQHQLSKPAGTERNADIGSTPSKN